MAQFPQAECFKNQKKLFEVYELLHSVFDSQQIKTPKAESWFPGALKHFPSRETLGTKKKRQETFWTFLVVNLKLFSGISQMMCLNGTIPLLLKHRQNR